MVKIRKKLFCLLLSLITVFCFLPVLPIAQAAPAKWYVRYDVNGGTDAPKQQIKRKDAPVQIASARPVREGYTFKCWDTEKNGGGTLYYPGSEYFENQDLKLYARWTPKTYFVVFYANGGRKAPKRQVKGPNERVELTTDIPVRDGYTFVCWNTRIDGKGTDYLPGQPYGRRDSSILYARWKPIQVCYRFNPNGGTFSNTGVHTVKAGATIRIPKTIPVRAGYTFTQWNTERDGSGKAYLAGFYYPMETGGLLYAQWKHNK